MLSHINYINFTTLLQNNQWAPFQKSPDAISENLNFQTLELGLRPRSQKLSARSRFIRAKTQNFLKTNKTMKEVEIFPHLDSLHLNYPYCNLGATVVYHSGLFEPR